MNIMWFLRTGNERGTAFPRRLMRKFWLNVLWIIRKELMVRLHRGNADSRLSLRSQLLIILMTIHSSTRWIRLHSLRAEHKFSQDYDSSHKYRTLATPVFLRGDLSCGSTVAHLKTLLERWTVRVDLGPVINRLSDHVMMTIKARRWRKAPPAAYCHCNG